MTEQQIKWATSHDWFVAVLDSGKGVLVTDRYVTRDGVEHADSKEFSNYRRLRDWAGY